MCVWSIQGRTSSGGLVNILYFDSNCPNNEAQTFSVILKSKRLNAPYIQKSHNLFITAEAGVEKKVSYSPISTT